VFSAEIVPDEGGETGWADMRAAYDALDDATRAKVETLSARHSLHYSQAKLGHKPKAGSDYSGYGFHDGPVPFSAIEMFLDLLRSTHGENLLRLKGIIELAEDPSRPLVVHAVQSILHPPARLAAWPDATRGTRLVLITLDMPEDYVRRLFAAVAGQPLVDTPDRAALAANPLAIAGFRF